MTDPKQYYAFISYKREDKKWAEWLQHKLEHYRFPTNLNGRTDLPKNIRPTFRDVSELAAGVLADEIDKALHNSEWLIVICSPRSAKSPWVCKEAQTFIDLGREDHIIPFVIEGEPFAKDPNLECFPDALLHLIGGKELLAVNINEMGRDAAAIKVVARMFGLRFDTLWQRHERELRHKRNWILSGVATFFLLVISVSGLIWKQNNNLKEITSRAAAKAAEELVEQGDSYLAQKVALAALDMSYTSEAEIALCKASSHHTAILKHPADVEYAKFSPNGLLIATASQDNVIRIWDAQTGILIRKMKGHSNCINTVDFSPNGKFLVSSSSDKTIRIWNVVTGNEMQKLDGHMEIVWTAFYSPDGKYISSTSNDNTIRIWDAVF